MFILPTFILSLAFSYLSSVISDISQSKLSAVTVVKAEATVEREREERKEEEKDKAIKIMIRKYYLRYDEHHVYCSLVELHDCTDIGFNTTHLYRYIHIHTKELRSGCGIIITGGLPTAVTPTCDLF